MFTPIRFIRVGFLQKTLPGDPGRFREGLPDEERTILFDNRVSERSRVPGSDELLNPWPLLGPLASKDRKAGQAGENQCRAHREQMLAVASIRSDYGVPQFDVAIKVIIEISRNGSRPG